MKIEMRLDERSGVVVPEIRDVTWGLWGAELPEHAAIQRLVKAGFPIWLPSHRDVEVPHSPLLEMFAIIEGESGSYVRAWHANVLRNPPITGEIVLNELGQMTVRSIDLGFIQRNVNVTDIALAPNTGTMEEWVNAQFAAYPELARADLSAMVGYSLWQDRGFQPWYAYRPGTEAYQAKKMRGAKAIANYLLRTQVGKMADGKFARVDFAPNLP